MGYFQHRCEILRYKRRNRRSIRPSKREIQISLSSISMAMTRGAQSLKSPDLVDWLKDQTRHAWIVWWSVNTFILPRGGASTFLTKFVGALRHAIHLSLPIRFSYARRHACRCDESPLFSGSAGPSSCSLIPLFLSHSLSIELCRLWR